VKQLVRCAAAPGVTAVPVVGTQVFDAGRDVGVVTSAAIGPSSEQVVALAYVHRDSAEVGRTVSLGDLPTTISAVTA
jgi:glycine cleavage system aminomethyltransferase T